MIRRTSSSLTLLALLVSVLVASPVSATPSLEGQQWGLRQVRAPGAWVTTRGAGATIAIVDSGVDRSHPELAGRIAGGATFVGCPDAPGGCGDGDPRSGGDPRPSHHGTHVAGIALAAADGQGVTGVAPQARLLAVKVLADDGSGSTVGTTADIAAGIRWAARNGADVINLSLGEGPGTQPLHLLGPFRRVNEAIAEAVAGGAVVVAAAGNDFGVPACSEPAFDPQVICVVATDRFEQRAVYSNLGVDRGLNVVSAPGGAAFLGCDDDVVSTYLAGTTDRRCPDLPAGYGTLAGTSMASPHVAGVAALSAALGRPAAETVDLILGTARNPLTGVRGVYDPSYGFGIVDAEAVVGADVDVAVSRHAGSDRVATAVAVSQRSHPDGAASVVVARADAYADALAGAPLARFRDAPLLLTGRDRLAASTADEVARLGADTAYLLGGEAALSDRVAQDLRARGLRVVRIQGATRFATAAGIAHALPSRDRVYVVEGANADPGRGWPDALSASGLAAAFAEPILLTLRDQLPRETADVVGRDTEVVIVGGTASVSQSVEDQLRARAGRVRRIAGADRYATSVAVAREARERGVSVRSVWVATGRAFPDGLAAGAAAGTTGSLFVLVDGQDLDGSPAARDFLAQRADEVEQAMLAGGRAAISAETEQRIRDLLR